MSYLIGYFKLLALLAVTAALYPALHLVWLGELPAHLGQTAATFGVLALFGLLVTLISLPGRTPADKEPV